MRDFLRVTLQEFQSEISGHSKYYKVELQDFEQSIIVMVWLRLW